MSRPRTNDPIGTSDNPVCASDPARLDELTAEFLRRLQYVCQSYTYWANQPVAHADFQSSLARLERAVSEPEQTGATMKRIHPELELLISHHARRFAKERGGNGDEVTEGDILLAIQHVIEVVSPLRGAPKGRNLRRHVEGLVALIQQFSGKPVLAYRNRNKVYDPHFGEGISQIVLIVFRGLEPKIREGRIARIVLDARSQNAGKPMRFIDYFPCYGMTVTDDGSLHSPLVTVEQFEPAFPIYCPN